MNSTIDLTQLVLERTVRIQRDAIAWSKGASLRDAVSEALRDARVFSPLTLGIAERPGDRHRLAPAPSSSVLARGSWACGVWAQLKRRGGGSTSEAAPEPLGMARNVDSNPELGLDEALGGDAPVATIPWFCQVIR